MRMFRMVLVIALVAAASVAAAQEAGVHPQAPASGGKLVLWPLEVRFDTLEAGDTAYRTVTVRNEGDSALSVYSHIRKSNTLTITHLTSNPIAPGDSDYIEIRFQPVDARTHVAYLDVMALHDWKVIRITAYSRDKPRQHAAVSPAELDFDSTAAGMQTLQTLTIRNSGGPANLAVTSQTVTGRGFSMVKPAGQSVSPGDSTLATIMYAPIAAGLDSGSFRIETDDPSRQSLTIPLRGRCVPFPGARIYCDPIPWYTWLTSMGTSREDSVCIRNIGTSDLVIFSQKIDVDSLEYAIIRPARSPLAASDSAYVSILFTDHRHGYGGGWLIHYGVLRLTTNDPVNPVFDIVLEAPTISHAEQMPGSPSGFVLHQNYPNPFDAARAEGTTLEFDLAEAGTVQLSVYSAIGRRVAVLDEAWHEAGRYRCRWDAGQLAPGVYTAVLRVATRSGAAAPSCIRMLCTR